MVIFEIKTPAHYCFRNSVFFAIALIADTTKSQVSGMFRRVVCCPMGLLTLLTVISSTVMWAILDPTLEPYLRKVSRLNNAQFRKTASSSPFCSFLVM